MPFSADPAAELPVHDHPGTRSLIPLTRGAIELHRHGLAEPDSDGRFARLRDRDTRSLESGETGWYGLRHRNVHSIEAGPGFTLLLSARKTIHAAQRPAIYTPGSDGANPARDILALTLETRPQIFAETGVAS